MKRGDLWRDSLPGSILAWVFVATFLLIPAIFARFEPLALFATFAVGAMAFSPLDSPLRRIGLILLSIAWLVSLVPALGASIPWKVALFFGSLTIVATDVAREEGLGVPILRFVRSLQVQAWGMTVWATMFGLSVLVAVDHQIGRSGLPAAWRWVGLPLALVMILPRSRGGGTLRGIIGALAVVGGVSFWIWQKEVKSAESIVQAGWNLMLGLSIVNLAHKSWAKVRPRREDSEEESSSAVAIRTHSNVGMP